MIYVQHLLGIGHLMRARHLAQCMADRGFVVHLVSGGMAIGGRLPRGVDNVQLPPLRVSDASFTPLRDPDLVPIDERYRERRRELLLAAYDRAAPDAVIFETFPFGRRALRFELLPLLDRIAHGTPRPLVLSSIRDILQLQPKPQREHEMVAWAKQWFDAILVHGDARFARFEETFANGDDLAPMVRYTGFVGERVEEADAPTDVGTRDEVVVSAGGGGVGIELLALALAAQRHSTLAHLTWRVLAGPNISDDGLARLAREAGPRAVVERARVDFRAVLRRARVSISQAGYNTTLDVMTSGTRPVMVPFTGNGETEQAERGRRLAALGAAIVLHDRGLTAEALAHAVDQAATREFAPFAFDLDGGERTAVIVEDMVRAAAPRLQPIVT